MSDRLRVIIAPGIFPPDSGGPATFAPVLAEHLASRGHSIRVVTNGQSPDGFDERYPFDVVRIPRNSSVVTRHLKQVSTLVREIRAFDPDVVLSNAFDLQSVTAATLTRTPVVTKVVGDRAWERARYRDGVEDGIEDFQDNSYPPHILIYKWLRTLQARGADHVVTPSEYLRTLVCSWGVPASNTSVVYNSISDNLGLTVESPEPRITTVGRLVDWKGIEGVIDAFEYVAEEHADAELSIIGDGPQRETLEQQAARTSVTDRITFHGKLPHEEVLKYVADSRVFVLNSTYEGLPHTVLEAMACNTPAVVSDAGGNPEVVIDGKTGFVVPQGDSKAIAERVDTLFSNPQLRDRLTSAAHERLSETFSEKQMIDQYENLLMELSEMRD